MSELTVKTGRNQLEKFEQLVALRMMGHPLAACARLLNISRVSAHNWTKEPLFIAMLAREKSDFRAATGTAIISGALAGVRLMESIVNDFRLPVHQRMEAARYLIELEKNNQAQIPNATEDQLAQVLFPEVVADDLEPVKELPATTQTYEELFNQLHLPAEKTGV